MSLTAVTVTVIPEIEAERRRMLRFAGYTVFVAGSFQEGCELVRRVQPDVLIADVRLQDYNGLHLAMRAREESPRTRALIVGEPDVVLERDAQALGASYVTSSARLRALIESIRNGRDHDIAHAPR